MALKQPAFDPDRAVEAFLHYRAREEGHITRALFERNLAAKLKMPLFAADIGPLLAAGYRPGVITTTTAIKANVKSESSINWSLSSGTKRQSRSASAQGH